jgi:hypothetical protein
VWPELWAGPITSFYTGGIMPKCGTGKSGTAKQSKPAAKKPAAKKAK